MVVAHCGEFFQAAWLERKRVLRLPTALRFGLLHLQPFVDLHEPEHTCRIQLLFIRFESKRFEKRLAEADVRKPRMVEVDAQRQVIKLWSLAAVASGHTSGEQGYVESEST